MNRHTLTCLGASLLAVALSACRKPDSRAARADTDTLIAATGTNAEGTANDTSGDAGSGMGTCLAHFTGKVNVDLKCDMVALRVLPGQFSLMLRGMTDANSFEVNVAADKAFAAGTFDSETDDFTGTRVMLTEGNMMDNPTAVTSYEWNPDQDGKWAWTPKDGGPTGNHTWNKLVITSAGTSTPIGPSGARGTVTGRLIGGAQMDARCNENDACKPDVDYTVTFSTP